MKYIKTNNRRHLIIKLELFIRVNCKWNDERAERLDNVEYI